MLSMRKRGGVHLIILNALPLASRLLKVYTCPHLDMHRTFISYVPTIPPFDRCSTLIAPIQNFGHCIFSSSTFPIFGLFPALVIQLLLFSLSLRSSLWFKVTAMVDDDGRCRAGPLVKDPYSCWGCESFLQGPVAALTHPHQRGLHPSGAPKASWPLPPLLRHLFSFVKVSLHWFNPNSLGPIIQCNVSIVYRATTASSCSVSELWFLVY